MRKSFTRLFGLFMLLSMIGFYAVAQPELDPSEGSSDVGMGTGMVFTMTFDDDVTVNSGSGVVSLNEWNGGPVELDPVQILNDGTTKWTSLLGSESTVEIIGGKQVKITFQYDLQEMKSYYITVSADAFLVGGNVWDGIQADPGAGNDPATDNPNTLGTWDNLGGPVGNYEWEFTVEDASLALPTLFPPDNSIDVANPGLQTTLQMTFAEDIEIVSEYNGMRTSIGLYKANGDLVDLIYLQDLAIAGFFDYEEPGTKKEYVVTLDGTGGGLATNRVTVTAAIGSPDALALEELEEYYVRVTAGAIQDGAGNVEAGVLGKNDNTTWNFVAADVTDPEVTAKIGTNQLPDALVGGRADVKNIAERPTIELTFTDNFAINNTCGSYSFVIQDSYSKYNDAETPGKHAVDGFTTTEISDIVDLAYWDNGAGVYVAVGFAEISSASNVMKISPNVDLPHNAIIRVRVNDAGNVVKAQDGSNNLVAETDFFFETGDFVRPQFLAGLDDANISHDDKNGDDGYNDANLFVDVVLTYDVDINDKRTASVSGLPHLESTPTSLVIYTNWVPDGDPVPEVADVKAGKKIEYNTDNVRYELGAADFGLEPDTDYDFYFWAMDVADPDGDGGATGNEMLKADMVKVDFHSADLFVDKKADFMTFSDGSDSDEVGRNADIVLNFDEEVKLDGVATWNDVITITVPDGTFINDFGEGTLAGDPDEIVGFTATLDVATNSILTIDLTNADARNEDGAANFAKLLSNTEYTITLDKSKFSDDASGAISNAADDDDENNYGDDNHLAANEVLTFTTEDYEGPLAFFSPIEGSGFGTPEILDTAGLVLTITFDETPYTEAGAPLTNSNIVGGAQDYVELIEIDGITNPNVPASITIVDNVVTIAPTVDYVSERRYMMKVSSLIEDENGYPIFTYMNTGVFIEGFDANSNESEFETADLDIPDVMITAVNKNDGGDNDATNDTEGTVAVSNDSDIKVTFAEGIREIASSTLIDDMDENMIRALIKLHKVDGSGNILEDVEFEVINILNPALATGNPANDNPTVAYIDPIDYPAVKLFDAGATYKVTVLAGLEDDAGNDVGEVTQDITIWEAAPIASVTPPTTSPADDQVASVELENQQLIFYFTEAVTPNGNNIAVSDGGAPVNIVSNGVGVVISNNSKTFTYDLPTPLTSDVAYTITIPVGTFIANDNPHPVWPTVADGAYVINFNTVDGIAPTIDLESDVTALSGGILYNAATLTYNPISFDEVIVLTFDSDIKIGDGDVWVKRVDNATTIAQLSNADLSIEVKNGNELHIDVDDDQFAYGLEYFIEMDGSKVQDLAGNDFEWERSVNDPGNWYQGGFYNTGVVPQGNVLFSTIADTPIPTYDYASFLPVPASDDVALGYQPLVIKLTGPVKLSSNLTVGNRQLDIINETDGDNTEYSIDMYGGGVVVNGNTITIDPRVQFPNYQLEQDSDYEINLDDDVLVKDSGTTSPAIAGFVSNYTGAVNWHFTTEDETRPRIASITYDMVGTTGTVDKTTEIVVTFTEPVALVGGNTWQDVFDFDALNPAVAPFYNQGVDGTTATGTNCDIDLANTELDDSKTVLTIVLDAPLEVSADERTVTITTNPGTFQDIVTDATPNTNAVDPYDVPAQAVFVVEDERKPIITNATDNGNLLSVDGDEVTIAVDTDEDATVYVVAVDHGDGMPNETTMLASTHKFTVDADDGLVTYTYTGLEECDDKDIYVMAEDAVKNVSDEDVANGNQPFGPIRKQTSDVTPPALVVGNETYPEDGGEIPMFTTYYGAVPTPVKIFFDEEIAWTATPHNFVVRDLYTNVDLDVVATIVAPVAAEDDWYIELLPAGGANWTAGEYYVEMDYGSIEDVPCNGAVPNEYPDAFYGNEEFNFTIKAANTQPALVNIYTQDAFDATPTALDGNEEVVFANGDRIYLKYDKAVAVNTNGDIVSPLQPIYVYRYDNAGAAAQEVISVTPSNVGLVDGDPTMVWIQMRHLLNNTYKEHYRIELPQNMILDPEYDLDASTKDDYTPLTGDAFLASAGDISLDGPFIDFWALDSNSPNAVFTSVWEHEFEGNRYYGSGAPYGELGDNFPTRTVSATNQPQADNSDFEVGNAANFPNTTIYFEVRELGDGDIYMYNAAGGSVPGAALVDGNPYNAFFTMTYVDGNNNTVNVPFNAVWEDIANPANDKNRFKIDVVGDLPGETTITLKCLNDKLADEYNNTLVPNDDPSDVIENHPYVFTTWKDKSPTVGFDVTETDNDNDLTPDVVVDHSVRTSQRPVMTVTFSDKVLIADVYQPLQDQDVLDLLQLEEVGSGTLYDLKVKMNDDGITYEVELADGEASLTSEEIYKLTILSDGNVGVNDGDIDLVEDYRTYTKNGNLFIQPLADREYTFQVGDFQDPDEGAVAFYPNGMDDVVPSAPLNYVGSPFVGNNEDYIVAKFSEDIDFGTTNEPIQIRYAWATGPQSNEAGVIASEVKIGDAGLEIRNGDELWIPASFLESFEGYFVTIPEDFIVDMAGYVYDGISTEYDWTFQTDDGTPPTVIGAYPPIWDPVTGIVEPATDTYIHQNVSVNTSWYLDFDENVQIPADAGYIVIYKLDDSYNGDYNFGGHTPDVDDGNAVVVISVNDAVNVRLTGTDPNNGLVSDRLEFDLPNTSEFEALSKDDYYYIRYNEGIVVDNLASPNPVAARNGDGEFSWDFVTSAHVQPQVATTVPVNGDVVNQEPLLTINFDMEKAPINRGIGNIRIYEYLDNAEPFTTIDVEDTDQVTFVDDYTIEINPSIQLEDNVDKYYVLIDASAVVSKIETGDFFLDADGDVGMYNTDDWFFATAVDETAPALIDSTSAVVNSIDSDTACVVDQFGVIAEIELYDYNGIQAGAAGGFGVYQGNAEASELLYTIPATDANVMITSVADANGKYMDAQTVKIDVSAALAAAGIELMQETEYFITIDEGAIVDKSRADVPNEIVAMDDPSVWAFTINDTDAPVVVSAEPQSDDVESDMMNIVLTFDEDVAVGSNTEVTVTDGENVMTYTIDDSNIEGSVVTIEVTGLVDKTEYTVTYPDSLVMDLPFGACNDVEGNVGDTFTFTTDDNEVPVIAGSLTRSAVGYIITVTAQEPIAPVVGTIKVASDVDTLDVDVATGVTVDGTVVYTIPYDDLTEGLVYEAVIPASAYQDTAVVANLNANTATVTIDTGDNVPPTLVDASPQGVIENVSGIELEATFTEDVQIMGDIIVTDGTDTIDVSASVANSVVTIVPNEAFALDVDYNVIIAEGVVLDLAGLPYAQVAPWTFKLVDTGFCSALPVLIPSDGSDAMTKEDVDTLVVEFCEPIQTVAGNVEIYEIGAGVDNEVIYTIPVADCTVKDNKLLIPTDTDVLVDFEKYGVTIEDGAILDAVGNAYDNGVLDLGNPTVWNFTMGDNTAPIVALSLDPEYDQENLPNTFAVNLSFTEDVVYVNEDNVTVSTGTVASITGSGDTYVVTVTAADGDTVSLSVLTGIMDASMRNNLAEEVIGTYVIGDNSAPELVFNALSDPQQTVFTVELVFNEDVEGVEEATSVNVGEITMFTAVSATTYTVEIAASEEDSVTLTVDNTVTDLSENMNPFAGDSITLVVGDFTGPIVEADPVDGTADLPNSFPVALDFSDDAIVVAENITVMVNGISADADSITASEGVVYTVYVTGADEDVVTISVSDTIKDEAGNVITTEDLEFTYTIGDNTPPELSYINPETAIDTVQTFDVEFAFNEKVTDVESLVVVEGASEYTIVELVSDLAYKLTLTGEYEATIKLIIPSEVTDYAGNAFVADTFTYTIGVGDIEAPTASMYIESNLPDFEVKVVFNEEVTGMVADVVSIDGGTLADVTGEGKEYIITGTADASPSVVTVTIGDGVEDLATNAYAGGSIAINIVDVVAPIVTVDEQTVYNHFGESVEVTSNEDGEILFVVEGETSGIRMDVQADTPVQVSTDGLAVGTYEVYAIDGSGNMSEVSVNKVTVQELTTTSISDLRQGKSAMADVVKVKGIVTAVDRNGFYMQDSNDEYSGIYIYTGTTASDDVVIPEVDVNYKVSVIGEFTSHNGLDEIASIVEVELLTESLGFKVEAMVVDDVTTIGDPEESMLVQVKGASEGAIDEYGNWLVNNGTPGNTAIISNYIMEEDYSPIETHWYKVVGVVWEGNSGGEQVFKVEPRTVADITDLTANDVQDLAISINVYPNPFSDYIMIDVSNNVEITKAVITNVAGQLIKEVDYPQDKIPTSELRSGYYFISLHTEEGIAKTERIIKR